LPDGDGRYFINPLVVETGPDTTFNLSDVAAYQASGGQLFWVDTQEGTYFLGSLEQGTAPASDARKAQAKASVKRPPSSHAYPNAGGNVTGEVSPPHRGNPEAGLCR